jgi:TrmH family RNA methyltransferase
MPETNAAMTHAATPPADARLRRITSPANPAVKAVRALHQKKARAETGRFLAEGLRILTEAVHLGHRLDTLVILPEMRDHRLGAPLVQACLDAGGEVLEVSEAVLAKIARKDNPQGAVGVFPQAWADLADVEVARDFCWVVLEAPRDPGNVGTVLRTCDSVGAEGVILLDQACDPYALEGVRASMGSIFAVRLARADFDGFQAWRARQPARLVGTTLDAGRDYQAVRYPRPTLLLMGNEQSGLPDRHAAACDELVRLPMRGRADSLNLSIATAVMLYEIYNQDRRRA